MMDQITMSKEDFDKILDVIADYNRTDETSWGGRWEVDNEWYLDIARRGVDVLRKYGREPANAFDPNDPLI